MDNVTFELTLREILGAKVHKSAHENICGDRLSFHGHKVIRNRPRIDGKRENDQIYFAMLEHPEDAGKFTDLMDEAKLDHWFPSVISFLPCEKDLSYMENQPGLRDIDIEIQDSDDYPTQVHKRDGDYMNKSVVYFALDPADPKASLDNLRLLAKVPSHQDVNLPSK